MSDQRERKTPLLALRALSSSLFGTALLSLFFSLGYHRRQRSDEKLDEFDAGDSLARGKFKVQVTHFKRSSNVDLLHLKAFEGHLKDREYDALEDPAYIEVLRAVNARYARVKRIEPLPEFLSASR